MSNILMTTNGKSVGLGCQASIDIANGCLNRCENCYAAKTSRIGDAFFTKGLDIKTLDINKFKASCTSFKKKGINYSRLGKHSDPFCGDLTPITKEVIKAATESDVKLVIISKSISYDKDLSKLIKDGTHVLHTSLGMITTADSNKKRLDEYDKFKEDDINIRVRITADVTKQVPNYITNIKKEDTIVTPLRFSSKDNAVIYESDLTKFKFSKGFYRPNVIDKSWSDKYDNYCGEIGDKTYCCNCLIGE